MKAATEKFTFDQAVTEVFNDPNTRDLMAVGDTPPRLMVIVIERVLQKNGVLEDLIGNYEFLYEPDLDGLAVQLGLYGYWTTLTTKTHQAIGIEVQTALNVSARLWDALHNLVAPLIQERWNDAETN